MKIRLYRTFSLLTAILLLSCSKDDDCSCSYDIHNKWEATEFMSIESMYYAKENEYNPILEFKNNGTITFLLDKNNGTGTFILGENNELEITNLGWTDMCCDSDFSEKFVEMLPQVNSYTIEKNTLKLFVSEWGWIEFEMISD